MEELMKKFEECLNTWIDLPKYVYTEEYKKAFINFVEEKQANGQILEPTFSTMVLHHETSDRNPYFEFDREISKEEWIVELTEADNEIWGSDIDCGSKEEAIEKGMEAAKKEGLKSFRIGKKEPCGMATIDVDTIIENAQEQLYDEVGEVSETYLEDITKEQEQELEEALNKVFYDWHKKHKLFPNCYKILNDEVIEVR